MTYLIVEEDVIGVLSNAELPAAVGGGANPFKDLIEFLDKTRGRWLSQDNYKGGRAALNKLVTREHGASPTGSLIYTSPEFYSHRLPTSVLPTAFGLFGALGLSFELIHYPCFVTLTDAEYAQDVPAYLPKSTITNEDETVSNVTWNNWFDGTTSTHRSADGNNYVPLVARYNDVAGTILTQLIAGGYDVKTMNEFPVGE
jgi:hypothetical protein